jgi:formamidopyrimidine-DNA glycosylase
MPELPEVETVARGLRRELLSHVIVDTQVLWERTIDRPDVSLFCASLRGGRIVDVFRRGKFVAISLSTDQTLLIHLRMTGQLLVQGIDEQPLQPGVEDDPHTRVRFRLDDGRWLRFTDTRKFGRMYLVDDPNEVLGKLGIEPLSDAFTPDRLAQMLARRKGRIKPLLLNQGFVAGLGNIYADEALWRARVHPLRPADSLSQDEVVGLHRGIVSILREAIEGGGTSLRDNQYRQPDGEAGGYQELLAVYGRTGGACPRCGSEIQRLVVGQRGTHVCPQCQLSPEDASP